MYAMQRFEGEVELARVAGKAFYWVCNGTCVGYREGERESVGEDNWMMKVPWAFIVALILVFFKARSGYKNRKANQKK